MKDSVLTLRLNILENEPQISQKAAEIFWNACEKSVSEKGDFNVALSGGSTPLKFFHLLADNYYPNFFKRLPVNIFWVDERCVPADHPDSNYGNCRKILTDPQNLIKFYPIHGNCEPMQAAEEYENLLAAILPKRNNLPVFDLILLGLGADGHTASIFPDSFTLQENKCLAACDYVEKLRSFRITLTLPVINNADMCVFLVKGKEKHEALTKALNLLGKPEIPAQFIRPEYGPLVWVVDGSAAAGE